MERPASQDPVALLRSDRARAAAAQDPCANLCTVASVDQHGHPHARTLVLRDVEGALAVFSNRTSPKWSQLDGPVPVAVVVWLPVLNLQYRLRCATRPVPAAIVHASWQLRPAIPKRLDWFYTHQRPQGAPVADRMQLLADLANVVLPEPLVAPHTAGGLYLEPFVVDRLDLAQPDGIHDRRHFEFRDDGWFETVRVP
jgi:pyridoxamine 5'-phosphate oxidase